MQVSSCLNPQSVYNKYLGRFITVPCGKCAACQPNKGLPWTERLEFERKHHEHCYFITLTYSDKYLPLICRKSHMFNDELDLAVHSVDSLKDTYYFNDLLLKFPEKDEVFNFNYRKYRGIPCLSHEDISKFIKAVKVFYKDIPFSFFYAGEYGPTGYRPHFHVLIFCNEMLFENPAVLNSLWSAWLIRALPSITESAVKSIRLGLRPNDSIGRIDCQPVVTSSSAYVAQYLNCTSHLPAIFSDKPFRPFHGQSRKELLGLSQFTDLQLAQFFYGSSVSFIDVSDYGVKTSFKRLPTFVLNRLFPRLDGASQWSPYDVSRLVCACTPYVRKNSTKEFLNDYLCVSPIYPASFIINKYVGVDEVSLDSRKYKLLRALSFARSVVRLCHCYPVGINGVLASIVQAHSNLELLKLNEFYKLQEELFNDNGLDFRFCASLYDLRNSDGSLNSRYLSRLGLTPHSYVYYSNFKRIPQYERYELIMNKVLRDTTKTKKRNDFQNSYKHYESLIKQKYGII